MAEKCCKMKAGLHIMLSRRIRNGVLTGTAALGVGAVAFYVSPMGQFYSLTGSLWPKSHIESLCDPIAVKGWTDEGLLLADGRTVSLPGIRRLPKTSVALSRAVKDGVEIQADGQVVGLLKVWHWCGNDPMKNDVRRIPIGPLLCYLREGEPTKPVHDDDMEPMSSNGGFSDHGWSVSEYVGFAHFFMPRHPEWVWPSGRQS